MSRNGSLAVILLLIVVGGLRVRGEQEQQILRRNAAAVAAPTLDSSLLKMGTGAPAAQDIPINEPVELDGYTRQQFFDLRTSSVNKYSALVDGQYKPSFAIYGQIVDGKPWWGLEGQFCAGPGEHGPDGVSEETRFALNPFLLLAVDEPHAFIMHGPCFPVYAHPAKLTWDARNQLAIVTYDMQKFYQERGSLPLSNIPIFFRLENTNARDFGYQFVYVAPGMSANVTAWQSSTLLQSPTLLKGFLHCGGSCGYPRGCNNGSPDQPELTFTVSRLPAKLYCKLWKQRPQSVEDPGDFIFVILLE